MPSVLNDSATGGRTRSDSNPDDTGQSSPQLRLRLAWCGPKARGYPRVRTKKTPVARLPRTRKETARVALMVLDRVHAEEAANLRPPLARRAVQAA